MQQRLIRGIQTRGSVIGFGTWGVGGETPGGTSYGAISEAQAIKCIKHAFDMGVRFFDTSPAYGYGNSETRLGLALENCREDCIIATKGGLYRYEAGPDFSEISLSTELDNSLRRLNTDYVDLFQLHNPPANIMVQNPTLVGLLDRFKKTGTCRAIGVSVKSPADALALLKAYPFDTVQLNLNMMDVRALKDGVLDYCEANDISVLARTPLCFGFLSLAIDEATGFAAADHRAHWSAEQLKLWSSGARETQVIAAQHDTVGASPAARALRFCLLHPAVKTVLTGPMSLKEIDENAAAGRLPPLNRQCLNDIAALNKRRSFVSPKR